MQIGIEINDLVLQRLLSALSGGARKEIHRVAAYGMMVLCRKWLRREASRRHGSANRVGGKPTGHLEQAAESMLSRADASEGAIEVFSPGFGWVFRSIQIQPKRARALTLPVAAESYGVRAGELARKGWVLFRPKRKSILFGVSPVDGKVKPLYILKGGVTLRQDRSLLPPDEAIAKAAADAALTYINQILQGASRGS